MTVRNKVVQTNRVLRANRDHPNVHKMACMRTLFGRIESHCTIADAKMKRDAVPLPV